MTVQALLLKTGKLQGVGFIRRGPGSYLRMHSPSFKIFQSCRFRNVIYLHTNCGFISQVRTHSERTVCYVKSECQFYNLS